MSKPNSGPSPPRDPASAAPLSRKHVVLAWLWVGLCTLGIFLTVPVARSVRNYVEERWGLSVFGFSVLAAVAIALAGLVYLLWFRWRVRDFPRYLWLVLVAATYVYFTLKLWKRPEEAIHFLEYGLLGFLLFRALRFRIPDHGVFLAAFLVGATVGIFDEVLQWIIPLRYWDFRDVGLNALSSGLSQVAIWKGIQPPLRKSGIGRRSFRVVSVLFSFPLILIGLCASNTPKRVEAYTRNLGVLAFLRQEEPMNEIKHKHRDPEIGVFYSRLSIEELRQEDRTRAREYGQILKEWSRKKYGDFLRTFPGYAQPFLHEMRVHIFRRNRYFSLARKSESEAEREENLFVAYKENRILEKYFGQTLKESPYAWPRRRASAIEGSVDTTGFYRSPVSAGTAIPLQGIELWGLILGLLLVLTGINIRLSRKKIPPEKAPGR